MLTWNCNKKAKVKNKQCREDLNRMAPKETTKQVAMYRIGFQLLPSLRSYNGAFAFVSLEDP